MEDALFKSYPQVISSPSKFWNKQFLPCDRPLKPPLPNVSNLDEDKGFFQLSPPSNLTVLKFLNNKFLPCDRPLEPPLPDVSHLDEEEFSKKQ